MKNAITTTTLILAAVSLMSACSWSGPVDHPSASKKEEGKVEEKAVETKNPFLNTFQGADAYCTGGTKAEKMRDVVVYTFITFKEDGTFVSDTNISEDQITHKEGTYSVKENVLTVTSSDGTVENSIFVFDGDALTLNRGPSEGNCPAGQSLFVKYVKYEPVSPQKEVEPEEAP